MTPSRLTRRALLSGAAGVTLGPLVGATGVRAQGNDGSIAALVDALGKNGRVHQQGDRDYAQPKSYNARFDCVRTKAIVRPTSTEGVQVFVRWAFENRRPFAVRGAGHSFEGKSSHPDLVVDLSAMKRIDLKSNGTLEVEAGVLLGEVYDRLSPRERVLPAGTCPTVGIVGHTLGGGIGDFLPMFGYAAQSLVEAELVTFAGQSLIVNADSIAGEISGKELLRLLRGAGQGSVGIVTRMTFETHDVSKMQIASFKIEASGMTAARAAAVIEACQNWRISMAPDMKRVVSAKLNLGRGGGSYSAEIAGLIVVRPDSPVTFEAVKAHLDGKLATNPDLGRVQIKRGLKAAGAIDSFRDDDETTHNRKRLKLYGASSALPAALPRRAIDHMLKNMTSNVYISAYTAGGIANEGKETSLHPCEFIVEWSTYVSKADTSHERRISRLRTDTVRLARFPGGRDDLGFPNYPDGQNRDYFADAVRLRTIAQDFDPRRLSTSSLLMPVRRDNDCG